ncbi:MAG: vitamin K epoxide reductase family protein [Gemmatimonadota bacterium]|nr:vitamin K epoxide reductase family protein [Gemmatimonadota bacterium]
MRTRMAAALLSLAGLFVSLYLYLYKLGYIGTLACGTGGCETVQFSSYSRLLGIEVPLLGVAGYAVLLGLSLLALQQRGNPRWPGLLRLLSGGGVAFSAYLTYLELFVIHAICRWCVGSAVIILLLFIAALFMRAETETATA